MVKFPTKTLERQLFGEGYTRIVGVDEVGMACLAGPVVVCALAVGPDFYEHPYPGLAGLRDSKMLSPGQRENYAEQLAQVPGLAWRIASCDPKTIDRINIYQASRVAMRKAIGELSLQENPMVLVDGNKLIHEMSLAQRAIIKGDRKVWAIAAASILAKVHRDGLMTNFAKEYPGYGFEVHKGYPTGIHRAALAKLGPCPLHRRSFHGVIDRI